MGGRSRLFPYESFDLDYVPKTGAWGGKVIFDTEELCGAFWAMIEDSRPHARSPSPLIPGAWPKD